MRRTGKMRDLIQQTSITPNDLICPVFVQENLAERTAVGAMPGAQRIPICDIVDEIESIRDLGIPAVMLFGIPDTKDYKGSSAFDENGIVQRAASQIKENFGDGIVVMADVCLCQYTESGHCGLMSADNRSVDNDSSLKVLAATAVSQAASGVDVVSPSAMMDGQVAAIRSALDDSNFNDVVIMSHSAKHRSGFYSPFRDAAECAPKFGDRAAYQVPYTNPRESMLEVESDVAEGVDIVMIKPALAYLDLIVETRRRFDLPVSAYSVSGEYAMVRSAAAAGYIDGTQIAIEILHAIKRAGADMIVTYFARDVAGSIQAQ